MNYENHYLSCVIQDDASIASSSAKKVNFHRRELDMVDRVNSPLKGACRYTEIEQWSDID